MKLKHIIAPIMLGLVLTLVAVDFAHARQEEGAEDAPRDCPPTLQATGYFQGQLFGLVDFSRLGSTPSNTMNFKVDGSPVSADRKWVWDNGSAFFYCWRKTLWNFFVDGATYLPPSGGAMIPAPPGPEEGSSPTSPPPNGGASYEWAPSGSGAPGTIICEVTDWYVGGYYVDTTIDYCWRRNF